MAHIAYKKEEGYPPYPYVVSTLFEEIFFGKHLQALYEQCRKEIREARNQMIYDEIDKYLESRAKEQQSPVSGSIRDNYR
jgi:hypothetical protein